MGYRERVRFISRPLFWRRHRADGLNGLDQSDMSDRSDESDLAWEAEIQPEIQRENFKDL